MKSNTSWCRPHRDFISTTVVSILENWSCSTVSLFIFCLQHFVLIGGKWKPFVASLWTAYFLIFIFYMVRTLSTTTTVIILL